MEGAHGQIMGGHMGIKKTTEKIQSAFYWPGIQSDLTRLCKSCDVYQKTVSKKISAEGTVREDAAD